VRRRGEVIPDALLAHLAPLGWQHINLTGDYSGVPATHSAQTGSGRYAARQLNRSQPQREHVPGSPRLLYYPARFMA